MRRMVIRMIANGSLAAFSSSVPPAVPGVARPTPPSPLVRVAAPLPARDAAAPVARPGQILPRGSLLDLRV